MACSSSSAASANMEFLNTINTLPDEIALKIVRMAAARRGDCLGKYGFPKYDHDFLVDVLCKVSLRFRRLAMDRSLWTGCVGINHNGDLGRADFVVRHCLHGGTTSFILRGTVDEENRQALLTANPSLRLITTLQDINVNEGEIALYCDTWYTYSGSDEEEAA